MNLTALEQRYHLLAADFQAGRIEAAAFMAALDQLQFQDEWGRTWMIGAQTGGWYYYDGQSWRQADPRQAERFPYVDSQGQSWQQEAGSGVWYYYQPETGAWLKANQAAGRPTP